MVDAFVQVMRTNDDFVGPVNLGNPEEVTILELATAIKELLGSNVDLKHLALPENDPTRRCPDITLAQNTLEWSPKITLKEGLVKTIEYFHTALSKTSSDS